MPFFSPRIGPFANSRRGFTLIELLVTIGIIALLAGLIFPAISKMQKASQQGQCLSNLRQVYQLCYQDILDNNMQVPPAYNQAGTTVAGVPNQSGWIDNTWNVMTSYKTKSILSEKAFGCPSQRAARKLAANARTFSMNSVLASTYWNGSGRVPPINYTQFAQPAKSVLFTDGAYDTTTPYNSAVNGGNKMPEAAHDGYSDMVFLDGHAEKRKIADVPLAPTALDTPATIGTPASIFWLGR